LKEGTARLTNTATDAHANAIALHFAPHPDQYLKIQSQSQISTLQQTAALCL
jgi:hypothetical protein